MGLRHTLPRAGSGCLRFRSLVDRRPRPGLPLLLALAAIVAGTLTGSSGAFAGPLTVAPVTWDVVGLDSNNVNTGPAAFPIGVRVCNTGSDPATGVVATWSWKTAQGSFTGPAEGATVSVGAMTAGECRDVLFEVTLNRNPSSRKKSREYQITVTGDGGLSASGPRRTLYIQPLVSQARNSTKKLAGPGGCNLAYTVCDPAPLNLIVGRTYTYKLYGETSTAYKQIETFASLNASFLQVVSTSATYSNPAGAGSPSWYGDACGWDPSTRACVGPVNIAGGKAGGRVVVTIVAKAVATGTLAASSIKPVIYDFSGASYHYNADHDSFALTGGAITARYELEATVTGNGKVTSLPAGTTSTGASSGVDCGGTGTTCAVGYGSGTAVTLTATGLGLDTFTGWSGGGCTGLLPTCIVTMDQSRSVTASFTGQASYPLTVSKVGVGSVAASSGAVSCGATCVANYASGDVVTLTASPTTGWAFDGWSGTGCSGTGTCTVTMSAARSVTASFSEQTYVLTTAVTGNGIVSSDAGIVYCGNGNTSCSDVYGSGTVVTLTASPGSGQSLSSWSGACSGNASTCVVTMTEARSVTASFTGTTSYTLDVATGGSGTGTVTSSPAGINCGATCSATYAEGTSVTLTASAGGGSSFVGWSGDCSGTGTTCTVSMSQARDVTASFGTPQTLTVTKAGSGSGTVTSSPAGISCGATCSASFAESSSVTLTAAAAAGSAFTGWSGDCSGTGACTVTLSQARAVTATFVPAYTLTVTRSGSGTGSVSSTPAGVDCGSTCSAAFADGTSVTLTASAASGSRFGGWSGEGCSGTGTCTVTMSAARNVTATFVATYTLTVTKAGAGSGTVSSDVGALDCGSTCAVDYDTGTSVTLAASASAGSRFGGWSGAGCSGTGTCTVSMTQAREVTATFVAIYALTVTKAGSGSGTVSGSGIDCGATCSADYDDGTLVTLTASTSSGSVFGGWSGAGCTGTGTCTVTMSAARSVTATFGTAYTLTVTKAGSGFGSVSSSLLGIDCGATCSSDFEDGAGVTLSASATAGSRFAGWSGEGCSGTGTCTVTMSAARSVTATFVAVYALTVTKTGTGSGVVSSNVGGLDCGSTCAVAYDSGTAVVLGATASAGSTFVGWSGAGCSGTGACTVTMSQARAVTATFTAVHALTVTTVGSGSVAGGGTYDHGTDVTPTATAASGWRFAGWSGDCSGTGSCTVTMTQARSVTATFVAVFTLTVTKAGSGSGTVTGGGIACGVTCSGDHDDGESATLSAVASLGSRFDGWSGAGCSGTGSCTVTLSQARAVTATFTAVHTLTVTTVGSGSVTGAGTYDHGTDVTPTATAAPGWRFAGWSGDCSSAATCAVTMTQARNVTATFVEIDTPTVPPVGLPTVAGGALNALTVTKAGAGSGSVTGTGIACGAACTSEYGAGEPVTLTAEAAPGSRFVGWTGEGCSGTGACIVTMSQARNVTATFAPQSVPLELRLAGGGSIACRDGCRRAYDSGTLVTLRAKPKRGQWFVGWSGACHGRRPTCTVAMSQARLVTARFGPALVLMLRLPSRFVYHAPHEHATTRGFVTWRGRPLAGARVGLVITCPGRQASAVLRTDRRGRVSFTWGTELRDSVRLLRCRVDGRVRAKGLTAAARKPGSLGFIHPLWLERVEGGAIRIWGRADEPVVLVTDGRAIASARIGRDGWVEVSAGGIRAGSKVWVRGPHGHVSHRITGRSGARP